MRNESGIVFSTFVSLGTYRAAVSLKYVLVNGLIVADVTSNAYDCIIASVLSFKSASRRRMIAMRLSAQRFPMLDGSESGMATFVNSSTALTCSSVKDIEFGRLGEPFSNKAY